MNNLLIISLALFVMSRLKNKAVLFNDFESSVSWYSPAFQNGKIWGIDPFIILAIIDQESAGNPQAEGDGGNSHGLMQIQQGALTDVINMQGFKVISHNDLFDAEINIRYGTAYLSLMLKANNGNMYESLRSYNQGHAGKNRTDRNQLSKGKSYAKDVITKSVELKNEFAI